MNGNSNFNSDFEMYENQSGVKMNSKKSTKKIIIIFSVVFIVIIVIGLLFLSNRTRVLKCIQESELLGLKMLDTTNVYFKGDKVERVDAKIDFDLGEYLMYKDEFIEKIREEYSNSVDINITSEDSKVSIELSANKNNFDKLSVSNDENYDEIKIKLENKGFKCE